MSTFVLIVVGQSFGGFTAPLVAARVPVDALVFVTAMVPAPRDWSERRQGQRKRRKACEKRRGSSGRGLVTE